MGIPIVTGSNDPDSDEQDGYRIVRSDFELPPIEFTPGGTGRPGLGEYRLAGLGRGAAHERSPGDPARGQALADPLGTRTLLPSIGAEPGLDESLAAIHERRRVTFDYRGEARRVEPWRLQQRLGRWYLLGRDVDRDAPRHFKLSRLTSPVRPIGRPGAFDIPGSEALASVGGVDPDTDATARGGAGAGVAGFRCGAPRLRSGRETCQRGSSCSESAGPSPRASSGRSVRSAPTPSSRTRRICGRRSSPGSGAWLVRRRSEVLRPDQAPPQPGSLSAAQRSGRHRRRGRRLRGHGGSGPARSGGAPVLRSAGRVLRRPVPRRPRWRTGGRIRLPEQRGRAPSSPHAARGRGDQPACGARTDHRDLGWFGRGEERSWGSSERVAACEPRRRRPGHRRRTRTSLRAAGGRRGAKRRHNRPCRPFRRSGPTSSSPRG